MDNRKLITPPSTYPLSVSELKSHLSIESTDFDTLLQAYIAAAVSYIERQSGLAVMPQTWEFYLPCWPSIALIPKNPVASITSVKYYDENNTEQTLNGTNYRLNIRSNLSYVEFDANASLPNLYDRSDAIAIRYVAGTATPAEEIKQIVRLLCGAWFEFREGEIDVSSKELELGVSRLIRNIQSGNYV